MIFQVKCCCGAELTVRAWFVRDVDAQWWVDLHHGCAKALAAKVAGEKEASHG